MSVSQLLSFRPARLLPLPPPLPPASCPCFLAAAIYEKLNTASVGHPSPITSAAYNPARPRLSSHSVRFPRRRSRSRTSTHATLSVIPPALLGSADHQLQLADVTRHACSATRGVLPRPARRLRGGSTAAQCRWSYRT